MDLYLQHDDIFVKHLHSALHIVVIINLKDKRGRTVSRWAHSSRTDCQDYTPGWSERSHSSSTSQHAPGRRALGSEGGVQSRGGGWVLPNRKMHKLIQRDILIKQPDQTDNWPGGAVLEDEMWPRSGWGEHEVLQKKQMVYLQPSKNKT